MECRIKENCRILRKLIMNQIEKDDRFRVLIKKNPESFLNEVNVHSEIEKDILKLINTKIVELTCDQVRQWELEDLLDIVFVHECFILTYNKYKPSNKIPIDIEIF